MAEARNLVLLTTGGTGGHVFPAEALADALTRRGVRLALATDRRGHAYPGALRNLERHQIHAAAMAGRSLPKLFKAGFEMAWGYLQARRLLRRLRPQAVIGFGGYASVPVMLAASHLGVPTILHEQNAIMGRANRLLAPRVTTIATSFPITRHLRSMDEAKILLTGNPVRKAFHTICERPYPPLGLGDPFVVLILGGSQGTHVFADVIPTAMAALAPETRRRLRITQQCRPEDLEAVDAQYKALGIKAEIASFFDDVPERFAKAHLVVSRAGASTVAELTAAGRPAILVPYPTATDDHQTANAHALEEAGGAWLMPEPFFTPDALAARITSFLELPVLLNKAATSAHALRRADAAERLAEAVCKCLPNTNGTPTRTTQGVTA
ncbi:undecaprenyldiphospho-muramoylpentapeptide beta-N-acetylglucosaminyltransferase [Rhodospirillaceae bacterium AH-315-P19]|nr:undecaprenyldiphospho-muramoylpentapeptide beta-N-acetylglucosaminyltransferase [Rhodospirillaceae bacterium AH-315-P19]